MRRIHMRFPEGKGKALTLSYDDGVEQDQRLIEVMKKNGLKGTFNINSGLYASPGMKYNPGNVHRRMSLEDCRKVYLNSGMEIACHTWTHALGERLSSCLNMQQIVKDRENLESQYDCTVRGLAYPGGQYNDEVIEIMRYAGIVYGRTVCSAHDFRLPTDWYHMSPTCHHNDPQLMEFAEKFVEIPVLYDSVLFLLWGHSYEFEENDNWEVIEQFADYMGGRNDIWYATNIQIYDYVHAFENLIFHIDGKSVYNPSAMEIFLEADGELFCITPGQEKALTYAAYDKRR